MKNDGIASKCGEDSREWDSFDQIVEQVRAAFGDVPAPELNNLIEEAVSAARKDKSGRRPDK